MRSQRNMNISAAPAQNTQGREQILPPCDPCEIRRAKGALKEMLLYQEVAGLGGKTGGLARTLLLPLVGRNQF